jgi:hypothetical protein
MSYAINARIVGSRPLPTPLTLTSTSLIPSAFAFSPITEPAFDAANGVPFFAPLNPSDQDEVQNRVLPS